MRLTCKATVMKNNLNQYTMKWSGKNLEQSVWITQSEVIKQGNNIKRYLTFKPWLDSHKGKYTCHLIMKDHPLVVKSFLISGMLLAYIYRVVGSNFGMVTPYRKKIFYKGQHKTTYQIQLPSMSIKMTLYLRISIKEN